MQLVGRGQDTASKGCFQSREYQLQLLWHCMDFLAQLQQALYVTHHAYLYDLLQIVFACLMAVTMTCAQYGYPGYPYPGAPHGAPQPVADTPEVAAARAAHFAAYNAAASAAAAAPEYGHGAPAYGHGAPAYPAPYPGAAPGYGSPYAAAPTLVNGVPADTPEVAAAKAAHFAAHAQAGNHYGWRNRILADSAPLFIEV
jgi:hypothetical protein